MKKFLVFAAAAFALVACVQPEELPVVDPEVNGDGAVAFSVYTSRTGATRAGTPGDVTNANIWNKTGYGFGVFAYYTAGEKYDANAKPNFMYNQKVYKDSQDAAAWKYEPVKYWPNEYGNAAVSDEVDYVTFFAYAPWTEFEPTTGDVTGDKTKNIISVNKNNATGDPIIKYVVDTDPASSVDLLFGVAAPSADGNYSAIDTTYNKTANLITPGYPFIDLMKPGNPKNDKISFNLKHSLAKVKFTIDYIADDFTPNGTSEVINANETRIFVRSFKIGGWATKGALNLNNKEGGKAGEPLWKDYDGVKDLAFNDVTFHDGRKDGKEGDVNGIQTNEENQGLNPNIVENFSAPVTVDNKLVFNHVWDTTAANSAYKTKGVTEKPQLLFGGDSTKNGGYFYIIPRNEPGNSVDATIVYDVETIDPALAGLLSDNATHGSSIENVISKQNILGPGVDFEAGKQYLIKIHIGMTSVKIEAVVTDWVVTNDEEVDLPDNQPMPCWTIEGVPGYFLTDPALGIEVPVKIYNQSNWADALAAGPIKDYYANADTVKNADGEFFRAGAGRYNATADKYDDNSGFGFVPASVWNAYGYTRCWKGAVQDNFGTANVEANLGESVFVIDLGANPLTGVNKIEFTYGDQVKDDVVNAAWISAKAAKNESWLWGFVKQEFAVTDVPTTITAKYFYSGTAVKHETKY